MTGANQGIGLEIVRQLCKSFDGKVILSGTYLRLCVYTVCVYAQQTEVTTHYIAAPADRKIVSDFHG